VQLQVPKDKIDVIPNGVDIKKFYPMPREAARQELGLSNRRMILSVGKLTPNKGFDMLVRAVKILADRFRDADVDLTIVGEGPYRSQLNKTVASLQLDGRVRLEGPVSHEKLRQWYSAADVFCLASETEGWPNVILESLACGTPVIASPAGGVPEIICSDRVGLLVKRDATQIASAIRAALNKTWKSGDLVEYAKNYTWERTASAVLEVFESVLGRSPCSGSSIRQSRDEDERTHHSALGAKYES
jgi:glycosyltransferase involved in cell wall biosynthesis